MSQTQFTQRYQEKSSKWSKSVIIIKLSYNLWGFFFGDSHLETKLKKKSIEKQNTSGNKSQVKGKHSLFLPVSWSNKPS